MLNLVGPPYEVGLQHGRKIGELVRGYYAFCRMLLQGVGNELLNDTLSRVEEGLRKGYPDSLEEMRGIADGSGLEYHHVLLMNFTSEVRSRASGGCTAFAALGDATRTGHPIIGKTRDMASQAYFPFQVAMNIRRLGKFHVFLAEAFSGMAVTGCGMNEHGLGLILNIIISIGDVDDSIGTQRAFLARQVLEECRTTDEAIDLISRTDLAYQGANFLVCDSNGEAALIEKSHRHQAIIRPTNGLVAATNHYTAPEMTEFDKVITQPSRIRLERIISLLNMKKRGIDRKLAGRFFRDHTHGLTINSICRHEPSGVNTVSAYILEPASKTVHIADGHPCQRRFRRYCPFANG